MANLIFPLSFICLLALEHFLPGRPQPRVRGWIPKGILFFFVVGATINIGGPPLVARALAGRTLLDLAAIPLSAAVPVTLLVTTLLGYWVHRLVHRVGWLWRWTHQMHHSAERVDLAGFAYSHPFDLMLNVAVTSLAVLLLGVSPPAALVAGYIAFLLALFQHLNVRTPRWLGYVVQRPEAHGIHHERGVHAHNYGLPLWDLAFGTFSNPIECTSAAGFWDGASRRVGAMLVGRDVSQPR